MPYYMHTSHWGCDSHGENWWPFEMQGRAKGIQRRNFSKSNKQLPRVEEIVWSFQLEHSRYSGIFLHSIQTLHGKNLKWATSSRVGHTAGLWRIKAGIHLHLNLDCKPRAHYKTPTLLCTLCDTAQNLERSQGKTSALEFCLTTTEILQSQHQYGWIYETTAPVQKLRVLMESRDEWGWKGPPEITWSNPCSPQLPRAQDLVQVGFEGWEL